MIVCLIFYSDWMVVNFYVVYQCMNLLGVDEMLLSYLVILLNEKEGK